jgi:hypothetical protein
MEKSRSSELGISFLELCVCLLLTGILVSAATYSIADLLRNESEAQVAASITTFFEQAAICALNSQTEVNVELGRNILTENFKGRTVKLPKVYKYILRFGGNRGTSSINFYPSGSSSAGTLTIQGNADSCVISQTISGARKTVCSYAS